MAGTNHDVEVVLPDGKRERTIGTGLRSIRSYVATRTPFGHGVVVDVDDQPAMDYDLPQLPPTGSMDPLVPPRDPLSSWFVCQDSKEGP